MFIKFNIKMFLLVSSILLIINTHIYSENNNYINLNIIDTGIIDAVKLYDNYIIKGKIKITYNYEWIDTLNNHNYDYKIIENNGIKMKKFYLFNKKDEIFFAFDGPKIRFDKDSNVSMYLSDKSRQNAMAYYISAYDGETYYYYQLNSLGINGLVIPTGLISNKILNKSTLYDPRYYGFYIMGVPVATFLNDKNIKPIGEEHINNINCQLFYDEKKNTKVWLVPSLMYRPILIEVIKDNIKSIIKITQKKNEENTIFPQLIEIDKYDISNNIPILKSKEQLIIHDDFEINKDLPDSLFKINFPKGITVLDQRINKNYIVE